MRNTNYGILLFLVSVTLVLSACHTEESPKPNAYPRIYYPEKRSTITYDMPDCPYTFDLPDYYLIDTRVTYFNEKPDDPCWVNLVCSDLNATIYLSYKELNNKNEYEKLIEDAYKLTFKHSTMADYIEPQEIENQYGVHGLIYYVGGDAASNFQFLVTDTTKNYVRGALYFNNRPNSDSLKPVVQFMIHDIEGMLSSWQWK